MTTTTTTMMTMTISQELFDETILENEECFNLTPQEALKETIDQFCQQLGQSPQQHSVVVSTHKNNNRTRMMMMMIPTAMSHLSLTHPSTTRGQMERKHRDQFRECLSLLDDCVGDDGMVSLSPSLLLPTTTSTTTPTTTATVVRAIATTDDADAAMGGVNDTAMEEETAAATNNDKIFEALSQLSIKLQSSNNNDNDDDDALPYLIIFQQSSSIYTLMSFLSILQPTSYDNITTLQTTTTQKKEEELYQLQILQGVIRTLITILSSSSSKNNSHGIKIRNQLRDVFSTTNGALERVVQLLFHFVLATTTTTSSATTTTPSLSSTQNGNKDNTKQSLQQGILLDLLQLSICSVKGCEGGKVAFVQSSSFPWKTLLESSSSSTKGQESAAADDDDDDSLVQTKKMITMCNTNRGGVQVLFWIISNAIVQINANNNNEESKVNNNMMMMMIIETTCQLLSTLCRYDDFRTGESASSSSSPAAAAGISTSSAHDHAMEFHRVNMESLLIKIGNTVLNDLLLLLNGDGGGDDIDSGNCHTNDEKDDGDDNKRRGVVLVKKKELLAAAVLTALRVLAVNDEIIQTMVALGVLPIVTKALRLSVSSTTTTTTIATTTTTTTSNDQNSNSSSSSSSSSSHTRSNLLRKHRLAAASLGLLRNLCGNDEIKTNLCLGSTTTTTTKDESSISATPSALPYLLRAMQLYPTISPIQEHACGTLAAMALRRPLNARAIMNSDGPRCIIMAMKRHEENVSVQRQGALAVRNIVSRLMRDLDNNDGSCGGGGDKNAASGGNATATTAGEEDARSDIRDRFAELGVEDVLRNIAGRHQGSVDEAYAALRDLGYSVTLTKINAEDLHEGNNLSNVAVVGRTRMFGEKHNSNFRPVYEQSAGLDSAVDEAVSNFGM